LLIDAPKNPGSTRTFRGIDTNGALGKGEAVTANARRRRLARYAICATRWTSRPSSVDLYFLAARETEPRRASWLQDVEQYQCPRSQS